MHQKAILGRGGGEAFAPPPNDLCSCLVYKQANVMASL